MIFAILRLNELTQLSATGTGKTYVGLRIVQALLANACPLPILIVCRTENGLDRFLEGILMFCDKGELLRVGELSDIAAAQHAKIIGMTVNDAAKHNYRRLINVFNLVPKIASKSHRE